MTQGTTDLSVLSGPIFLALRPNKDGMIAATAPSTTVVDLQKTVSRYNKQCVDASKKITGPVQTRSMRRGAATDGAELVYASRGGISHPQVMDQYRWNDVRVYMGYQGQETDSALRAFGREQHGLGVDVMQMVLHKVGLGNFYSVLTHRDVNFDTLCGSGRVEFDAWGIKSEAHIVALTAIMEYVKEKIRNGVPAEEAIRSYEAEPISNASVSLGTSHAGMFMGLRMAQQRLHQLR